MVTRASKPGFNRNALAFPQLPYGGAGFRLSALGGADRGPGNQPVTEHRVMAGGAQIARAERQRLDGLLGGQVGFWPRSIATAAVTKGTAKEVPVLVRTPLIEAAVQTSTPGAARSTWPPFTARR